MKRCCVFVDGENLRHSIVSLFKGEFNPKDYLPKNAKWAQMFDSFSTEAFSTQDVERVRTYWYAIAHLQCSPYNIDSLKDTEKLRNILSRDRSFREKLNGLRGNELRAQTQTIVRELQKRAESMRRRFDGWITLQNAICTKHEAIEFRRAGTIRYNLFDKSLGRETAVDVKLATDLIVLRETYDIAVIVSGDQDYVPAVQVVKDSGKRVVNVAFEERSGRLLPGGARVLNQMTDSSLRIPYSELKSWLMIDPGKEQS